MCDEKQLAEWARGAMTRRGFAKVAGAGAAAGTLGGCATMGITGALTEDMVSIPTTDGNMDAFFVRPQAKASPGVIFWPDIAGIRESKRQMARRLAGEGYAVLVANPYYRDVTADQFVDFADFAGNNGFQKVRPWREKLDAEAIRSDAAQLVEWLDAQSAVDSDRAMGSQGYCMGGPFAVWTATASDRVGAAASFHGGGLVDDSTRLSPHNLLDDTDAAYLIAIARNDHEKNPDHLEILRAAVAQAGDPSKVAVYSGDHGWTVPDSPSYDRAAAERAYADLMTMYRARLV